MKNLIKTILFTCFSIILVGAINIPSVHAATGSIKARASSTNVTLGNSVTVTVTVSSSAALGSWQFVLKYDTAKLKLTSTNNATYIADYGNGSKTSASYTYTFKTLAVGSASVSLQNALIVDWTTEAEIATATSGTTINISKAVVVTKSSNNNLSGLTVSEGTMTPSFDANTTEYTVNVDKLIDSITISATKADATAAVAGDGAQNVSEGLNNFNVTVTAENGTAKVYKIAVNVIDSNPIKVKLNKVEYTVIKKKGTLDVPDNYVDTTVSIAGVDVAAYQNDITKLVLVGLKDKDGNAKLYVYNANKETYKPYNEVLGGATKLYIYVPESDVDIPKGYTSKAIKINDIEVNVWQSDKNEDFYLVYGINVDTGKASFYSYDKKENTFQRFNNDQLKSLQTIVNQYLIIIIAVSSLSLILIWLVIYQFMKIKNFKKKKL